MGERCVVATAGSDLKRVLLRRVEDGELLHAMVADLRPLPPDVTPTQVPLDLIGDPYWLAAIRDAELLGELRESPHATKELVGACMARSGWCRSTVFEKRARFRETATVSALLPRPSPVWKTARLDERVEDIISDAIEKVYLTRQQHGVPHTVERVQRRCKDEGLPRPSCNTIRRRIEAICGSTKRKRRSHAKQARDLYTMVPDSYTDFCYALDVVLIDHALLDIIIVDEVSREPIGRPWLTAAIDAFSRAITGIFVDAHEPGFISTGACLAHAIARKEDYLKQLEQDAEWPIYGYPVTIHSDNGSDFRGHSMERASLIRAIEEHGVQMLQYRPGGRPGYGGIVERWFGTLQRQLIHTLPGTTHSNVQERGDYNSERHAVLSLRELEWQIVSWITTKYHHTPHSGIGRFTPLQKFMEGRHKCSDGRPGPGLPQLPADLAKMKIDFAPSFSVKIHREGVVHKRIWYYHPVFQEFVERDEPKKSKDDHIFHYDPHDMSRLYFYYEREGKYLEIPYKNGRHPPASKWELAAAAERVAAAGLRDYGEDEIFKELDRRTALVETASVRTKRARKRRQKVVIDPKFDLVKVNGPLSRDVGTFDVDFSSACPTS